MYAVAVSRQEDLFHMVTRLKGLYSHLCTLAFSILTTQSLLSVPTLQVH